MIVDVKFRISVESTSNLKKASDVLSWAFNELNYQGPVRVVAGDAIERGELPVPFEPFARATPNSIPDGPDDPRPNWHDPEDLFDPMGR